MHVPLHMNLFNGRRKSKPCRRNPIALRTAKTPQSFGSSECNRVTGEWIHFQGDVFVIFSFSSFLSGGLLLKEKFAPLELIILNVNPLFGRVFLTGEANKKLQKLSFLEKIMQKKHCGAVCFVCSGKRVPLIKVMTASSLILIHVYLEIRKLSGNIYILCVFTEKPYSNSLEHNVINIPVTTLGHATSLTSK